MNAIFNALDEATAVLKKLNASTLTPDQLQLTLMTLTNYDILNLISTEIRPDEEDAAVKEKKQNKANDLNKKADLFNDELQRIKQIRSTLNLEALDPIIEAAGKLIRPVYNFTANLQEDEE